MVIRIDSLIKSIATALDVVEQELLGASTNHGKRIAVLCAKMGKILCKTPDEIMSLAICALLHDNALTEYLLVSRTSGHYDPAMKKHCVFGERNIKTLGLKTNIKKFILYHHERADGKGPFGIKEGQGPVESELIAIADSIDVMYDLQTLSPDKLPALKKSIADEIGKQYSKIAATAMLEILNLDMLLSLKDEKIDETTEEAFIPWIVDVEAQSIMGLAGFISRIIDCKSEFTRKHSTQIANIAWFMSEYYKYSREESVMLYLAAALHDIGKLFTPTAILEKPGKLTAEEFIIIKDHISKTYELLKDIEGFQSICTWASNHHEKLTGAGYPFGKKADELDFNSRLMACIDIYQAVCEKRPYHPARDHAATMQILSQMADDGSIDKSIVNDLSIALAPFDGNGLPPPKLS